MTLKVRMLWDQWLKKIACWETTVLLWFCKTLFLDAGGLWVLIEEGYIKSNPIKLCSSWACFHTHTHLNTHKPCTCAGLCWKELIAEWKNLTSVFLITSDTSFLFVQSEKYHRAQQWPHLLTILICPSVFPSSSLKPQAHYFILRNVSF